MIWSLFERKTLDAGFDSVALAPGPWAAAASENRAIVNTAMAIRLIKRILLNFEDCKVTRPTLAVMVHLERERLPPTASYIEKQYRRKPHPVSTLELRDH